VRAAVLCFFSAQPGYQKKVFCKHMEKYVNKCFWIRVSPMKWRSWWEAICELVFPGVKLCSFCWQEIEGDKSCGICDTCSKTVMELSAKLRACPRCGYFTVVEPCPNCFEQGSDLTGVLSVAPYDGIYREMVYCLKYGGKKDLATPLGYLMASKLRLTGLDKKIGLIVPIPLYPAKEMERGYNQSGLLAREISCELGINCDNVLSRVYFEKTQTGLGRRERKSNLNGCFSLNFTGDINGRIILLVDDIVTTGATLSAAAHCLRQAGAGQVYGLTWAAGSDYQQDSWLQVEF